MALPKGFLGPIFLLMILLSKTSNFYWKFWQICYSKAFLVQSDCNGSRTLSHAAAVRPCMSCTGEIRYWWKIRYYLSGLDAISFRRFLLAVMPRKINGSCFSMFVQSVVMLLFQNVSVPQVLGVLLSKCFFFSALSASFYRFLENNME